jgi:cytosine/adenosine deaminase-related metal-dependent hydrolase
MDPGYIYLRTLFIAIQLLKTGSTMIMDDVAQQPYNDEANLEAIFRGYKKSGMRAYVGTHLGNVPMYQAIPFLEPFLDAEMKKKMSKSGEIPVSTYLDFLEKQIKAFNTPDSIQKYILSVSGPQRTCVGLMKGMRGLSETYNLPVVNHVLETRLQRSAGDELYGKSLIRFLEDNDLLYRNEAIIHSVWVDDYDIELIKKRNCSVLHCPSSNFQLGSGLAPIHKLVRAGINVALGSDNPSCNNNMNLFEQMKLTGMVHKVHHSDFRHWLGAEDAFRMATINGAKAALAENSVGSIEVGKKADLVILNANNATYIPKMNYTRQIVFCENGSSVRDVLIDGQLVVNHGVITTFDEAEVLSQVSAMGERFLYELKNADEESKLIADQLTQAYYIAHGQFK